MEPKLIYTNENGGSVELSARPPYHVNISRDVEGLSDVSAKIISSGTMGQDGETYIGNTIEPRTIDVTGNIRAKGEAEIGRLRRALNHVMNPKLAGTLRYEYGDFVREIPCRAEEAPVYKPGTWLQFHLSLWCPSPFWQESLAVEHYVAEWEGMFEFPEDEGLTLTEDWEVGRRSPNLIVNVPNDGDVDCGMVAVFEASGVVRNPALINAETREFIKLRTELRPGDRVEIATHYGNKTVTLLRNGLKSNVFRLFADGAAFLRLRVGDNLFTCAADEGLESLDISIRHTNYYLGV